MSIQLKELFWWSSASLRISHTDLIPDEVTESLGIVPVISQSPGESKVHHGDCKSAGYWCAQNGFDSPVRPDKAFEWIEDFVSEKAEYLGKLLQKGSDISIYVGVHSSVLALGFNLPSTPSISKLGINISIECSLLEAPAVNPPFLVTPHFSSLRSRCASA
jgi:hypothetical protein